MKNWEFYEDQIRGYEPMEFALIDGHFATCFYGNCCKCEFREKGKSCWDQRIEFLYQEHKEPIVLTDDEKALCKAFGRGYIARDKNNRLWWYGNKPKENNGYAWCTPEGGLCVMLNRLFPQCKFDFLKWEDEEPWEVQVDDEL